MFDELRKLAELKNAGILTDEEFTTQKARILAAASRFATALQNCPIRTAVGAPR